jgi:hypothetical protein
VLCRWTHRRVCNTVATHTTCSDSVDTADRQACTASTVRQCQEAAEQHATDNMRGHLGPRRAGQLSGCGTTIAHKTACPDCQQQWFAPIRRLWEHTGAVQSVLFGTSALVQRCCRLSAPRRYSQVLKHVGSLGDSTVPSELLLTLERNLCVAQLHRQYVLVPRRSRQVMPYRCGILASVRTALPSNADGLTHSNCKSCRQCARRGVRWRAVQADHFSFRAVRLDRTPGTARPGPARHGTARHGAARTAAQSSALHARSAASTCSAKRWATA